MKRKIISIITIGALLFSGVTPAIAADVEYMGSSNENSTMEIVDYEQPSEDSMNATFPWKSVFKAIKWVIVKVNNASFTRNPTIIDQGGNWVASSSGDVSFGNGSDDARRVRFSTKIDCTNNRLDVFAQTAVTGWLAKITIFVENSSGTEVAGGQVGHNQHIQI